MKKVKTYEWDWGRELDEIDREVDEYWREFDRVESMTDWNKKQESSKTEFANMLRNELGKDITDVVSGKVKVKLSFKEKLKYRIKRFFQTFS